MLLNPFFEKLNKTDNSNDIESIRNVFKNVIDGLLINPTVQTFNMMVYINSLFKSNMNILNENRDEELKENDVSNWGYTALQYI